MNEFVASNGVEVTYVEADDAIGMKAPLASGDSHAYTEWTGGRFAQALREFFQAEADERLGRFRHGRFLVYPDDEPDDVLVIDETAPDEPWRFARGSVSFTSDPGTAARAYFDAHPEPKPWHDAQPGDHWALHIASGVSLAGEFQLFKLTRWMNKDGWYFVPTDGGSVYRPTDSVITAGRRVWPEAAS